MTSKPQRGGKSPSTAANPSVPERLSLFEGFYRAMRKRFLLQRLVVVAAVPPSLADRAALGAHYEELTRRLERRHHVERVTGFLLVHPRVLLHAVESSSEVLVSVLQNLKDIQEDGRLVASAKVLLMSHDLPNRLFNQWSYKVLTEQARPLQGGDPEEETSTEDLVGTVRSMMLKLGSHLEIASEALPGSVLEETPDLVVPQEVLVRLLARPELLTPEQYLHTYHSPLHVRMDSGHVFGSSCATTV